MEKMRRARLEATLLRELSVLINRQLKDPRIPPLTVTSVRSAPDGRNALVTVALLRAGVISDDPEALKEYSRDETKEALLALNHAAAFLHREISRSLRIKVVPKFNFKLDRGLENTMTVHDLLKRVASESPAVSATAETGKNSDDDTSV